MAGNVTGFQRPYRFKQNATYKTAGMYQAVTYVGNSSKEVEVPEADNLRPVGVVSYQFEDSDLRHVAVQLDRISQVKAAEAIAFGEDVYVAAGGTVKPVSSLTTGDIANVLGESQNAAAVGEYAAILIRPKVYAVE